MRIVHVAESLPGGIASYWDEIGSYQSRCYGNENVAFIAPQPHLDYLANPHPGQAIGIRYAKRRPDALLKFGLQTVRMIKAFKPDIVHIHSSFAGAIVRPLLRKQRVNPKVVYCPHGWSFGMETSNWKRAIYADLERALVRNTDMIVVNSQSEKRLGAFFGIDCDKMQVIKNGLDPRAVPKSAQKGGPKGCLKVGFVGRHDPQKGLDILLETLRRYSFPGLEFHIVGKNIIDALPATAIATVQTNDVRFFGWLDRTKIPDFMRSLDVLVVPSRWEAFGFVVIEAMRQGVPVIASNRGALPEIIKHDVNGLLFDLDDPDALASTLRGLNGDCLRMMGENARSKFLEDFTSDRMNAELATLYEEVLSRNFGRREIIGPSRQSRTSYERAVASQE